jgi:hypothetical protein
MNAEDFDRNSTEYVEEPLYGATNNYGGQNNVAATAARAQSVHPSISHLLELP